MTLGAAAAGDAAAGDAAAAARRPTVSVVVIVRNGEAHLADALCSLRSPDCPPDEVLVVDGHSTDRTAAVARAEPGVTVLAQRSSGIAGAYNEGIAQARGDLVAFCSHDDRWLPGKLRAQVDWLAAHPDALFCVTHVLHVLAAGAASPPGFRRDLLERPVAGMIMECLVARREAFARVGPFDAALPVCNDTDWFARARDAAVPYGVLPDVYVHKRIHGANASLTDAAINTQLLRALRHSVARKRERETAGG